MHFKALFQHREIDQYCNNKKAYDFQTVHESYMKFLW